MCHVDSSDDGAKINEGGVIEEKRDKKVPEAQAETPRLHV